MAEYKLIQTNFFREGENENHLDFYAKTENGIRYISIRWNNTELGVTTIHQNILSSTSPSGVEFDTLRGINIKEAEQLYGNGPAARQVLVIFTCYGVNIGMAVYDIDYPYSHAYAEVCEGLYA